MLMLNINKNFIAFIYQTVLVKYFLTLGNEISYGKQFIEKIVQIMEEFMQIVGRAYNLYMCVG